MMKIAHIAAALDALAPNLYAESWDNTGLLIGDPDAATDAVLFCIDLTDAVLDEALARRAGMVMAYHPPIFKPIRSLRADRRSVVYRAAAAGLAVYSAHTAWDAVPGGANDLLADALGMAAERRALSPVLAEGAFKVTVFLPADDLAAVQAAAFAAGAGAYGLDGNYSECGFGAEGVGSFFPSEKANPAVGRRGARQCVPELRWETICPRRRLADVLRAVTEAHSYEVPAIDVVALTDAPVGFGLGRVGDLAEPVALSGLIERVKGVCGVESVLLVGAGRRMSAKIGAIAVGCGSCGEFLDRAAGSGAEVFVTGELRHHGALAAAAAGLTTICVNHSNSERLTLRPMAQRLGKACKGLKTMLSRKDADPFTIV